MYCFYNGCLGSVIFRTSFLSSDVYQRTGNFAVRCFCHADLFLWNLYDGAAVCGTVYSGCVKPCETGRLFFSVSKGHHCHSVDHAASNDRKSGDRWSVLGRTDFQCYWRYGMFCNHVAYNLAKAERRKLLFAVTEKIGGFRKQLELKKFKLFFLCIMHKEEGEENDKPRVVQSKQKEIM